MPFAPFATWGMSFRKRLLARDKSWVSLELCHVGLRLLC
jgi:hypothetical protein